MKTLALFLLAVVAFAAESGPLTDQRIFDLAALGVSSDEMIRIIASAPAVNFDLRPGSMENLTKAGVSDDVIKAMSAKQNGLALAAPVTRPIQVPPALQASTAKSNPQSVGLASLPPRQQVLPLIKIEDAISRGAQFRTRDEFLQKGLKGNRVQLSSLLGRDGISKRITFFTDFDIVAAASAAAAQQMRTLTPTDVQQLPLSGLLYANVLVYAMGTFPAAKVLRRYSADRAHLVLQIDGNIIQPVTKETLSVRDTSWSLPISLYTWYNIGHVSLLTGGALGSEGARAEMEFAFRLTPEQLNSNAVVILIDGDGRRYEETVDLPSIQ
jgi:hypothetical protein